MRNGCRRGAQTAPSKPLKAWRYTGGGHACETAEPQQDSSPRGDELWLQTRCPNSTFETAKSMEVQVVGTHAKRQSPSRIPAQGVANVAADDPNSTFETAKSMEVPMVGTDAKRQSPSRVPAQGVANVAADEVPKHAFETAKSMEARTRNGRAPAGFQPKGWPMWLQTRCPNTPSKPLKAWRYRWWARIRNGRAPAGFQPNPPDDPTEA